MEYIPLAEAETHFAAVLAKVEHGESVTLTRDGRPVAQMVPVVETPVKPLLGLFAEHDFKMTDDFDEWPEEEARALGMID